LSLPWRRQTIKKEKTMDWSILLFASKWVFIALVYFVLFVLLVTVRREMSQRIGASQPQAAAVGRLKIVQPGSDSRARAGAVLDLGPDSSLGAAPDNQIILNDRFISGHHARLRWDGSQWWLEDLGSRNGTLLEGRPLPPYRPEAIWPGASLRVGDVVLQLLE
jgi:hypothetical protein